MSNENQLEGAAAPDIVERQLMRIQSSPHFSHSRRYPSFLNYVVRKTLTGCQEDLKERTIGVEAFGRKPGYDLNSDPVVRVTAGEVRKRLAQYYYEPEHQEELRIELHPGSYVPEFKPAPGQGGGILSLEEPVTLESPVLPADVPRRDHTADGARTSKRAKGVTIALVGTLLLIMSLLFVSSYMRTSAVKLFWRPILEDHHPVLILVGSVLALTDASTAGVYDASVGLHALHSDPVALADTIALAKLQEVLSGHNKIINVESSAQASFPDLQKGPVILVSGFDNPWTMRLTDPLRFHFVRSAANTFEIEERADRKRRWSVYTLAPLDKVNEDYGLIARFHDPTTEQVVVVAAGIGENGTIAAAEALSDEQILTDLKQNKRMPREGGNFEAVVEVTIINGKPGPPRIVATYLW